MRVRIRLVLALHRIGKTILLGLVTIAMVIPGGNVALSQTGTTSYIAIDLHPAGFFSSYARGISGGQQVGYGSGPFTGGQHALLWSGSATSVVDLHPGGYTESYAYGTSGGQQVGWGRLVSPDPTLIGRADALLWSGTPGSVLDISAGFTLSAAVGVSGGQQVGWGQNALDTPPGVYARLWTNGGFGPVVNLNPVGFTYSNAWGISGSQQVGYGSGPFTGGQHALLWSGSPTSVVDLHPTGFTESYAYGVSGGQQVGYGSGPATGSNPHALLWQGTSTSVVDLNPTGFTSSQARGTSGAQQVGYGAGPATGNNWHALVWSGTAASAVDLHQFLPPGFLFSQAYGIDANGNIVGTAGGHAFLWLMKKPDPRLVVPKWYQAGIPNPDGCYRDPLTGMIVGCPQGWTLYPNNFWGPFPYDFDKSAPCLKDPAACTIRKEGCALTAFTILLNFFKNNLHSPAYPGYPLPGVPPLDPATPKDPQWPNNWRALFSKLNNGYVLWNNFAAYPKAQLTRVYLCSPANCGAYPSFPIIKPGSIDSATLTLINVLRNKVPVVLPIQDTSGTEHHFVVVTGWDSGRGTFLVNDPGDINVMTLKDVWSLPAVYNPGGTSYTQATVESSLANISHWKVYTDHKLVVQDPLTPEALGIYTDGPVEFMLTDPQFRRTGFDRTSNTVIEEIPASEYSTSVYSDEADFSFVKTPLKSLDMAIPMTGQYTLDVIGTGSGDFTIEVTSSDAAGNSITQTYSGTTAPGVSSQFTFQGGAIAFPAFAATLALSPSFQAFGAEGTFTPGPGGTISPMTQPVTIQIGDVYLATIPAGSFELTPQGTFIFGGVIQGVLLAAALTPTAGNSYAFAIAGAGAPNLPSANPVDVRLAIGNNGGSTSVNATFVP